MVRPTARVLALLELLQAGGTRTVADLAERLDVDRRTVRRYAEHLRELDVPVEAVRGRYGGYRLAGHAHLPPLMLTNEEAVATVWALLELDQNNAVGSLAAETALAKIRRVLPPSLSRQVGAVVDGVTFTRTPKAAEKPEGEYDPQRATRGIGAVLLQLATAAQGRHPVRFDHTSRHGRVTQREVHPHGIVAHRERLYLAAFDVTRAAQRTFRLDRISTVQVLPGRFATDDKMDPSSRSSGRCPRRRRNGTSRF